MMLCKRIVQLAPPLALAAILSACASDQGPSFRLEAQKENHQTSDFVDGRETIYSKFSLTEASLSVLQTTYRSGDPLWLNVGFSLNNTSSQPQACDLTPRAVFMEYTLDGENKTSRGYTSDEYAASERQNKYDAETYALLGIAQGFSQFGAVSPSLTASDLATHDDAIENRIVGNSKEYLKRTTLYPGEQHFGRVYMGPLVTPGESKLKLTVFCIAEQDSSGVRGYSHEFNYLLRQVSS